MRIWMDVLTWRDAKALKRWWNNNVGPFPECRTFNYHIVPSKTNPRFYALVRFERE